MKLSKATIVLAAILQPALSRDTNLRRNLKQLDDSDECTGLVQHTQYGNGSDSSNNDVSLVCETPSGEMYTVEVPPGWIKRMVTNGELTSGASQLVFAKGTTVDKSTGKVNNRSVPTITKKKVAPGLYAKKEKANGNGNGNNGGGNNGGGNNGKNKIRHLATSGAKSVLVVRVVASNAQTGFSNAQLSDSVFGTDGDAVNLKSQYNNCSHGQFQITPATNRSSALNGNIDKDIVNGATTVTIAAGVTSSSDDDERMRNQITVALNEQFGVTSPTQLADHVMYCLPPGSFGGVAYAFVNSWMSVYNNAWCTYPSAQMHELGHNFGLGHSNEGGAYKDQSGMMGYSYSQDEGPKMCFNAAKSWQLGWYSGKTYTIQPPSSNPPSNSGTYYMGKLQGAVDYMNSSSAKVLIKLNTASGNDYFISFNAKKGFNVGTLEGGNQVLIVTAGAEGNGYAESELVAKLGAGGNYQIPNFDGSGETLNVDVVAIDGSIDADVNICLGDCSTPPPQCTVSADCPVTGTDPCTENKCIEGSCQPIFNQSLCSDCNDGESLLEVDIRTDSYPTETGWQVVSKSTGQTVASGNGYAERGKDYPSGGMCVPDDLYTFTINDSYGDGICCSYGSGSYSVRYNSELVGSGGSFGTSEKFDFGEFSCPAGQTTLDVAILTDNYPGETTWNVKNDCDGSTVASDGPYPSKGYPYASGSLCVPENDKYTFTINDAYGDGICCSYGLGSFAVTFDGVEIGSGGEFGTQTTQTWGSC